MTTSTNFIRLDAERAEILARRQSAGIDQVRVRHPDLPGVRWMCAARNGGYYSRYTRGEGHAALCYFLPAHADRPNDYDPN